MPRDAPHPAEPTPRPLVRRVRIHNFKSIAACDVTLGPLNVLVGRNGSGKSNFLEALQFLATSVGPSLEPTLRKAGGLESILHRGAANTDALGIRAWLELPDGSEADYGFEIARGTQSFFVRRERLQIRRDGKLTANFDIKRRGRPETTHSPDFEMLAVQASVRLTPQPRPDRLYLETATSFAVFAPVLAALDRLDFCDPVPGAMRQLQAAALGERLHPDGENLAAVVGRLERDAPEVLRRVQQYLRTLVPHVTGVRRVTHDVWETLEFTQERSEARTSWTFNALSMSDGTLRALAILVALQGDGDGSPRFIGIEEPETALHPAAVGALLDALREASAHTQVVLTTHSADLLDRLDLDQERLLVAQSTGEAAQIALADPASLDAIQHHLFGAGELLRMDQLDVDRTAAKPPVDLFDEADP